MEPGDGGEPVSLGVPPAKPPGPAGASSVVTRLVSWRARFSRSVLTSLFTTVLDFSTLLLCVQVFGLNYVLGTWIGTVVGSLSNFAINRSWAFQDSKVTGGNQFMRFVLVQAGSSGLNTMGVWLLTRFLGVPYQASRLIAAAMVSLGWNYPMNHAVVFATTRKRVPPPV